jgi:hypothetical protein
MQTIIYSVLNEILGVLSHEFILHDIVVAKLTILSSLDE